MLSSATLPPAWAQGLFQAYAQGRQHFANNRGSTQGAVPNVCCLWVDEAHQQHTDCGTPAQFEAAHLAFAQRRIGQLAHVVTTDVRRRGKLIALDTNPATERGRLAVSPRAGVQPLAGVMATSIPLTEYALKAIFQK